MDFYKQDQRAARKMKEGVGKHTSETCIDFHKGIAHELPAGCGGDEDDDD